MTTVPLTATYIGQAGPTGIYRVDLGQSGLSSIQAITIYDDNVISGGSGGASGFDIDFVRFSTTLTSDPSTAGALPNDGSFDFSTAGVVFRPGFLRPYNPADNPAFDISRLFGTTGANVYDPAVATFGSLDAPFSAEGGALSLGEAGQATFLLNTAVGTSGQYLYFGDAGGGNDQVLVTVSDVRAAPAYTGVTLTGTIGDDIIALGQGFNIHLGAGNDAINGSSGNDTIFSGAGDDSLSGEVGNDALLGEDGNDIIAGGLGKDTLSGGLSNDTFVFGLADSGITRLTADVINDWNSTFDSIDMTRIGSKRNYMEDDTTVKSIEKAAAYAEETFTSKKTDHVFLYNKKTDTGYLFSDLDNNNRFETGLVLKGANSAKDFGFADII